MVETATLQRRTLPPGTQIGWRGDGRPIYLARGTRTGLIAATDDDDAAEADLDGDDAEDEDADGDDDDEPEDEWEPPTQAEWDSERAARHRANQQAAQRRKLLEQLGVKYDRQTGEPRDPQHIERILAAAATLNGAGPADTTVDNTVDTTPDDDDADTAPTSTNTATTADNTADKDRDTKAAVKRALERELPRAEARVVATWKPVAATLALQVALEQAGYSGSSPDFALRFVDLDEVTVVDGAITGIVEQVEDMKAEFPDLFKGGRRLNPRRGGSAADGGDKGRRQPPTRRRGWAEEISARIDSGR